MYPNESFARRDVLQILGACAGLAVGARSAVGIGRAATDATVKVKRRRNDSTLDGEPERCTLSDGVRSETGVALGDQVRVAADGTYPSGLYTVVGEARPRDSACMSDEGLDRLGFDTNARGSVRPYAPHPEYETRGEAAAADEYVELLEDRGSRMVACAPHGGWIEYRTDRQAERVADALGVTEWSCAGYNSGGGAYDRWHVTSTAISPRSFPELARIADRGFEYAVSFHGFSGSGIRVGGGAPTSLKTAVRDAIETVTGGSYDVALADPDGPYAGDSEANFVNWLTTDAGGVQIEQSWDVRADDWAAVADAVVDVYADRL